MALVALVLALVVGPNLPGAYGKGLLGVRDRNAGANATRVTLSPLVDIRGRLIGQSDVELFTVATDTPSYWRITALDRFDGSIWSSLSNYRPAGTRLPTLAPDASRADTATSRQEFVIGALSSIWLPAAFRPQKLSPSGDVRFDPDSASLATDKATSDGLHYTVESSLPRLTASELGAVGAPVPADIAARYLELPTNLPRQIQTTAQRVAGNETTPYAKAKALQDWFRANFVYSLNVPAGHDGSAMVAFLNNKQGYCEQFAGTYAAMARMLGLPARVAVGFTSGTKESDGLWHVTGKEAHAWPEVYLSGYGWVAFEPTPGRGLPGAEDYTNVPAAQAADAPATTVPDATAATDSTEPTADTVAPAPAPPAASSPSGPRIVVVGILLALAAAYLVGVPLAKRRRRRSRRAAAASPAERVLVAWEESAEAMAAAGLARRPDETAPEYAHRVRRAAGPAGAALVRLADDSSAAAWSAGGVAVDVALRAETEADGIATELRAQSTRRDRVRTALDPRPLLARPPRPPSPPRDASRAA
jgi:transglutaminase-like putative cysteine protease